MWPFNHLSRIESTDCYVVVEKVPGRRDLCEAKLARQWKDAFRIRYCWLNGVFHSFIDLDKDVRFWLDDKPVFAHNIGNLFGENSGLHMDQEISSEYYDKITETDLNVRMVEAVDRLDDRGMSINWKFWIIAAAIIGALFLLWKSGLIQSLINSFTGR